MLKHKIVKEIYNYISLSHLAFPQPVVFVIQGFKMVKEKVVNADKIKPKQTY